MKPLILVKHSLPEVVEHIPAREWILSEMGRERAKRLAEILSQYHPKAILSSTEPKAYETARILTENLGLSFQTVDGLHEHDRSNSPYYSKDKFQTLVQEFFKKPDKLVFGNETANQALARFCKAVDSVLELYENKSIIIVAHGTVISLFVSWLTGCDGYLLWRDLGLPSFVVLDLQSQSLLEIVNIS
jgi:broad specificity phosphatase PhoE